MTDNQKDRNYSRRFSFFESFWEQLEKLDLAGRGAYITAMCEWAFDGVDADFDDPRLDFTWPTMRAQLAESVRQSERNSANGRKGGRPRKSAGTSRRAAQKTARKAKVAESDEKQGDVPSPTESNDATAPGVGLAPLPPDAIDPDNPLPPMIGRSM